MSAPLARAGLPFEGEERVRARAFYLGQRLDPRRARDEGLSPSPALVPIGARGAAILFRYGVAVLFQVSDEEEPAALERARAATRELFERAEREEVEIVAHPDAQERAAEGVIRVKELTLERVQLVADVLAKSVVLAHYESAVKTAFDKLEPLAESLARGRSTGRRARALLTHIGTALLVETQTVARVEVSEKPDALWDLPELERFYARLADEYELVERHIALERKLALISRTAQTVLELLQNSRTLRVEWYIVALIVMELLLSLYDILPRALGAS
jgi:uncharacterized Rmd1/YagE family protein